MKTGVGYIACCLMVILLPLVSAQSPSCTALFNSARSQPGMRVRRRDELLNIAHGNLRPEKCNFMVNSTESARLGCTDITSTCDAPRLDVEFASAARFSTVCPPPSPLCDSGAIYRTIDGSCNNLKNPRWGQANTAERRTLPNVYDDGFGSPKTKACFGGTLPSPRKVSNMIHSSGTATVFEQSLSVLLMEFGQFLAHDFVLTKVFTKPDGTPLACCTTDINDPQCFPIRLPADEPFFQPGSCMNFARSSSTTDCSSIRQQLNSQSSYLDLSLVYGTSTSEAAFLRTFNGGQLKNVNTKLPADPADSTCVLSRPFDPAHYYCPIAGDGRVIEQPVLASMHTIFMREHNRLATELARMNPTWNDEMLYQEARKINIGQWQNIVYSEYLPTVLGSTALTKYNLKIRRQGFQNDYDPTIDASIANSFAVAVFRFGHSQIRNDVGMGVPYNYRVSASQSASEALERHFFEPNWYHSNNGQGLENMLHWATAVRCPFADRKVEDTVRQKLFQDDLGNSFDLVTLNIQRGRDHGVPGYTAFRTYCGLSKVSQFGVGPGGLVDHDAETASLLQQTYACPEDIDLFTGLLTERRSDGGLLGPTWQCLLATQFKHLREGDRFFFERYDQSNPRMGFNYQQLNSIKSVKLSDIICLNTNIPAIQPNAFHTPSSREDRDSGSNSLRRCRDYRGVDLRYWSERQEDRGYEGRVI